MKILLRSLVANALWLAILWAVTILVLSFLPASSIPKVNIWSPDKIVHTFIYMVLTILFGLVLWKQSPDKFQRNLIILITGCISFGWAIEILQPILTDRYYELYDVLANSVGVIIGSMIFNLFISKWLLFLES